MSPSESIHPFTLSIPQSALDDLQTRLRLTRWPDKEVVSDLTQGVPLATIQELCEYWQNKYNWRRCEALLNSYPQFTTTIDGVDIYFIHIRSKHEVALPMLLTHGWPGSVLEFKHVVDKFVDPLDGKDAFHLVVPALPGYGFSGKPTETGWDHRRVAKAWGMLMERLGYADGGWVAQGGDWGALVTASLGNQAPKGLRSVHFNSIYFDVKVRISFPECVLDADVFCRKKRKPLPKINQGRKERCILIVGGRSQVSADISCSSRRGRRHLAMAWLTHLSDKLPGSTKSSRIGRTMMEMWRLSSVKTRCSTPSCCTG